MPCVCVCAGVWRGVHAFVTQFSLRWRTVGSYAQIILVHFFHTLHFLAAFADLS